MFLYISRIPVVNCYPTYPIHGCYYYRGTMWFKDIRCISFSRVAACACGSSINLYLNYFCRKTETLGSVGPAHDPIRPMLCSRGPRSLQSFLHKAPSLFLSGSGFVAWRKISLGALFVLSSPGRSVASGAQLIGCLVFPCPLVKPGAKRTVCKHDRTHFLFLAGKHQYSVRTNNRVSQKYPLTVDTSVCIVTVVSGDASTEALFDG